MRVCFPSGYGPRHTGLGNELIPVAKACIASRELNIKMLPMAWGLNDRGYGIYFGTSRFDWIRPYVLSKLLPSYIFREADYLATSERDYGAAVRVFAEKLNLFNKRHYAFQTEGMWGGYIAIRKARPLIWAMLYNTRFTAQNMYEFQRRTEGARLVVAVNIRMADFTIPTPETNYRGLWNTRIALDWYARVCRSLVEELGAMVRVYLTTDGTPEEVKDFVEEFQPITTFDQSNRAISDLLLMAQADALVCSISSYSQWAAFLSGAPYIWYSPHLQPVDGKLTIWGSLGETPLPSEVGKLSRPRGVPADNDGKLPDWLFDYLSMRASMNSRANDLVNSGGVPEPNSAVA